MDTRDYLARVKRRHHIESDYALAKLLGVSRQLVSMWQTTDRTLDNANAFRVAELLELQPQLVVADMEHERAERAGKAEAAAYWREWAKRLAAAVAVAVLGAGNSGPGGSGPSSGAGSPGVSSGEYTKSRVGIRRRLQRSRAPSLWCPA